LPSVFLALGKELLCRVPVKLHSANHLALRKEPVSVVFYGTKRV
jgi:hypothetical protein